MNAADYMAAADQLTPRHIDEFLQLWYHDSQSFGLVTRSNHLFQCILPPVNFVKSYVTESVVCQGYLEKWQKDKLYLQQMHR